MQMEYYTYGNTDLVFKMFNTVAMMTGANSSFAGLITVSGVLAFLFLVSYGAFKGTLMPAAQWFFGVTLAWYAFFLPKVDVVIVDQTNPTVNQVVSNMPIGLAFVGNYSSQLGKWLVDNADKVFTPVNDISYANTGMVFGATAYAEARKLNLLDFVPDTQGDWAQFVNNCSNYDLSLYHKYTQQDVNETTNLMALLGNTNQVLTTSVAGQQMFCDQAYLQLVQTTSAFLSSQKFLNHVAMVLNPNLNTTSSMTATTANKTFAALGAGYDQMFSSNQHDAMEAIKQEVMINMVNGAALQNASVTGDHQQMAAAIASAQAEAQSITAWKSGSIMAAKYLPVINNLIEGLLIALFPIVMAAMVLAGWAMWNIVMMYFSVFLSIKLWPGLFAVVNGIANSVGSSNMHGASLGATGSTLGNAADALSVASQTQTIAGYMIVAVPVLAWYLVSGMKGGMEKLASAMAAPAAGAGTSAGSSVGSGNFNAGSSGWNNVNSNKIDASQSHTDPGQFRIANATGWTQGTLPKGGSLGPNGEVPEGTTGPSFHGATQNSLGISADASMSAGISNARKATVEESNSQTLQARSSESMAAANTSAAKWMTANSDAISKSSGNSQGISAQNKAAAQEAQKITQTLAARYATTDGTATQQAISADVSARLSGGTGGVGANASVGGNYAVTGSNSTAYQRDLSSMINNAKERGISFSSDVAEQVGQTKAFNSSLASNDQFAQETSSNLTASRQASRDAVTAHQKAQSYSEQSQADFKASASVSNNMNNQVGEAYEAVAGKNTIPNMSGDVPNKVMRAAMEGVSGASAPSTSGTMFDAGSTVPINRPSGGDDAVNVAYAGAVAGVQGFSGAGMSNVATTAGSLSGDVRGDLEAGSAQMANQNNQSIADTRAHVNHEGGDMQRSEAGLKAGMKAQADNLSWGQQIAGHGSPTALAAQNDVVSHLGGAVDGRYAQDPKDSASTVHAGESEKPKVLRKVTPRWQQRK